MFGKISVRRCLDCGQSTSEGLIPPPPGCSVLLQQTQPRQIPQNLHSPDSRPIDLSRATSHARHVTHDTSRTTRSRHRLRRQLTFPVGGTSCFGITPPTSDFIRRMTNLACAESVPAPCALDTSTMALIQHIVDS